MQSDHYVIVCFKCHQRFKYVEADNQLSNIRRCPDCGGALILMLAGEGDSDQEPRSNLKAVAR